jgi:hypothetical protein
MRVHAMPARLQIGQHNRAIAMPHQRGGQTIEFTARQQHVLAAERADNLLADAVAIALVLDKVEIGIASRQLLADDIEWLSADSFSISS